MRLHRYRFGGLSLHSNFALRGARPLADESRADADTILTFVAGPAPAAETIESSWGGRYRLRLGTCGNDWIFESALDGSFRLDRAGSALHIYCRTLPPQQDVIDVLLRRVLPRVAILSGKVALHAAAAACGDNALVFVGPSGAGKSTMAAHLVGRAGWQPLGEDYSILADPGDPVVEPGPTGVCVWPDMRDALGLPLSACSEMPGTGGKIRFELGAAEPLPAPRLKALIALERRDEGEAPSLAPLTRGEALIEATRQLVLFNPEQQLHAELGTQMGRINAMLRKVPAYRLCYPANPAALPETARLLEALVRG